MADATVIIAAWNAEDTVGASINSALGQSDVVVEVVVIDDASTDSTTAVAQAHSGCRVITLSENGGPSAARNAGLDASTGDWIVVLDADDTMHPARVRRMIDAAQAAKADIVLGSFARRDETGAPIEEPSILGPNEFGPSERLTTERYIRENSGRMGVRSLGYLKPLMRRACLEDLGLRYDPSLRNSEDFHLILEAIQAGAQVIVSTAPDYYYTVRPGSISYRINPTHIERLVQADDAFAARHAGALSQEAKDLMVARRAGLVQMMEGERVMQALKERRLGQALRLIASRPSSLGWVMAQVLEALGKRLRRFGGT